MQWMIVLINALQHGLYTAPPKPAVPSRPGLTGFLYDKTGVTGAWTLGVGLSAYLISKELYVFNAEVRLLSSSLSPPSLSPSLSSFSPSLFCPHHVIDSDCLLPPLQSAHTDSNSCGCGRCDHLAGKESRKTSG